MSYILDALKRADAERERGVVPGLYARQLTSSSTRTPSPTRTLMIIAIGTALLATLAVLLWLWRPASDLAPRMAPEQTATKLAPLPPVAPAPAPAPAPINPPEVATPAPATVVLPTSTMIARPVASASSTVVPKPTASAPAVAPAVAPLLADLSEEVRRQIPALTITGVVYSDNPGQRLLLVNNQVLPQGSLAAPEVALEEIGAKSSIFSFRGNRFRLSH
jgi:general secretion pathway protein B